MAEFAFVAELWISGQRKHAQRDARLRAQQEAMQKTMLSMATKEKTVREHATKLKYEKATFDKEK